MAITTPPHKRKLEEAKKGARESVKAVKPTKSTNRVRYWGPAEATPINLSIKSPGPQSFPGRVFKGWTTMTEEVSEQCRLSFLFLNIFPSFPLVPATRR